RPAVPQRSGRSPDGRGVCGSACATSCAGRDAPRHPADAPRPASLLSFRFPPYLLRMIQLAEISHTYRALLGRAAAVHALDRRSPEVAEGGALGLIGLNGAGKTTLLRVLLGFLRPSVGSATIAGQSPRSYVERHGVGYVPERVAIPA